MYLIMCIVCNVVDKDYVEAAIAVKSTVSADFMTIPLNVSKTFFHNITLEMLQSNLLNANLIALIF
jgi:hypothetical protein